LVQSASEELRAATRTKSVPKRRSPRSPTGSGNGAPTGPADLRGLQDLHIEIGALWLKKGYDALFSANALPAGSYTFS